MKRKTDSLCFILSAAILVLSLTFVLCSDNFPKKASASAGLPSPETAAGFPAYSDALLSVMIHFVDGAILEQERVLKALALLPQVQRGDWEGMKKTITPFQQSWGDAGIYWFALPNGRYYTVAKGLLDQTLTDRPYFAELLAGNTVVGALVVSKSTGKKSTVTAVPILNDRKQMIGAVGATLFLEKLDETLASAMSLPEGMVFYVLGKDGTTILHQKLDMVFDNPLTKDSPSLKTAAEKMLSTDSGEVEYEFNGFKKRVRYASSSLTGWRFVVGLNIAKL
jgi:hypothetical protein